MERIRWVNIARLVFALGVVALLVHGLPRPAAEPSHPPALGLPDGVLRPAPRIRSRPERRPAPLRRAPVRHTEPRRPARLHRRRPRSPAAGLPTPPVIPPPAAPAPPPPPPAAAEAGEFGP